VETSGATRTGEWDPLDDDEELEFEVEVVGGARGDGIVPLCR
jgi:hypothetical protein